MLSAKPNLELRHVNACRASISLEMHPSLLEDTSCNSTFINAAGLTEADGLNQRGMRYLCAWHPPKKKKSGKTAAKQAAKKHLG